MPDPILNVEGLQKQFLIRSGFLGLGSSRTVDAVSGVSLRLERGKTLAVVGESGCGKSTVGRCILRLEKPSAGRITLDGRQIESLAPSELRPIRKRIQVVFQDPFSSLNPRQKVREVLAEPLRNFGMVNNELDVDARVTELLRITGLPDDAAERWPHEFSGGQRQRIGIARALAPNPDVVICDEAVSALDVSVKAQVVNLLKRLQQETGVAFLFISHDLAIVENIAHRVAVMYLGQIVEYADRRKIFGHARHPYTRSLMSAVPVPDPSAKRERIVLRGDIPSPVNPPKGCRFHTRCPFAFERCRVEVPVLRSLGEGQSAACHLNDLLDAENPLLSAAKSQKERHS